MKNKKNITILLLFLIFFTTNAWAYYTSTEEINICGHIAEPIIKVEPLQETIEYKINKNSEKKEYLFSIKNFENEPNKKISEVDFEFYIEVKNSNNDFPINYKLYDCSSNQEILKENSMTEKINIYKNEEFNKIYKLEIFYQENLNSSDSTEVEIEINVNQII